MNYETVLKELDESFPTDFGGETPTNLLCLSIPQSYIESDIKVMVFGQETNDWYGSYSGVNHESWLKDCYNKFFNSGYCYSYGGQFWNGIARTIKLMQDKTGKTVGLLWNNIVKIGKENDRGRPNKISLKWQKKAMSLIIKEIEKAEPDVVIFFTGPNYDDLLHQVFEDISFRKLSDKNSRQLSLIKSSFLPKKSFRTYHPNYLWRNNINSYLNDIIDHVVENKT